MKKKNRNILIAAAAVLALFIVGAIVLNNFRGADDSVQVTKSEVSETEAKAEVSEPKNDKHGRVSNGSLNPRYAAGERPDRPLIVDWETSRITLSKKGELVDVVIYFPFVVSEFEVQEWQEGKIEPKSYIGENPPMNNVMVHKDASGVQGEWIKFQVTKETPDGLTPRPGLPRFGDEEFTSTHKWVKIQEL